MSKNRLQLDTLYQITPSVHFFNHNVFYPKIFIDGGSIDIYASEGDYSTGKMLPPSSLSDMVLERENTNISGYDTFFMLPIYIYMTQNTGTTTNILIDGINEPDIIEVAEDFA